jgi:hypothetical protein
MKCKIFRSSDIGSINNEINSFLTINNNIKIISITQSSSSGSNGGICLIITIIYKDEQ